MERIKDLSKIKMALGYVLLKVYMKNTMIVTPDAKSMGGPQVDYAEVVAFSSDVTDLKGGDIVLDFMTAKGFEWNNEQYVMIPRQGIKIVVESNNFINETKIQKRATKHLAN